MRRARVLEDALDALLVVLGRRRRRGLLVVEGDGGGGCLGGRFVLDEDGAVGTKRELATACGGVVGVVVGDAGSVRAQKHTHDHVVEDSQRLGAAMNDFRPPLLSRAVNARVAGPEGARSVNSGSA